MLSSIDPARINPSLSPDQVEALTYLVDNRPLPGRIECATLHALVEQGMATNDGATFWITHVGREMLGDPQPGRPRADDDGEPRPRKRAARQPREKVIRMCACGCGRETGGNFAPGHDARVVGALARELAANYPQHATDEGDAFFDLAMAKLPPDCDRLALKVSNAAMRYVAQAERERNKATRTKKAAK